MLSDYLLIVVGVPVVRFIPALTHGAFSLNSGNSLQVMGLSPVNTHR